MKKTVSAILTLIFVFSFAFPAFAAADGRVFTDTLSAGVYLKREMKKKTETVSFTYKAEKSADTDVSALGRALFNEFSDIAFAYTGVPDEGDYLLYTYDEMKMTASVYSSGNTVTYDYTLNISYFINALQEQELTKKINTMLSGIMPGKQTDYEKVRAIHDEILKTTEYDHEHGGDYNLKYSAYAAAVNGSAVCEGYSVLFARMCMEAGVECRVITGTALGGSHSWNAVKIGGIYYLVDCTWDDSEGGTSWFLRGESNFTGHKARPELMKDKIELSQSDFDPSVSPYQSKPLSGDADGDGTVSVSDARTTLRLAIALDYTGRYSFVFDCCDTDENGEISVGDARTVLRRAIGLE